MFSSKVDGSSEMLCHARALISCEAARVALRSMSADWADYG